MVIVDDGLDLTHPDFGSLADGSPKFDTLGSCVGTDVCVSGSSPLGDAPCTVGTDHEGRELGFHGTTCAAIAVGNANGVCSHGIAPGATLAGVLSPCPRRDSTTSVHHEVCKED